MSCAPSSADRALLRGLLGLALVAAAGCAGADWRAEAPPRPEPKGIASPEPVAFLPEDDLTPRVSPDGRYVVFVSQQTGNRDVWVRDFARRSTYPLTLSAVDDFDPDISPDGERIVFASRRSDAKGDLYLLEGFEAGGNPERLTREGSHDRSPTFAPDGRKVYFTQSYGIGDEFVAELDLESRRTRRLSPGPGFDPVASPDGRFLVYTEPGLGPEEAPHLVALRLTDGATRAVSAPDVPAGFARFFPSAASSAARLVFTRFPDDDDRSGHLDADDQASLWRLEVDLIGLFEGDRGAAGPPFPLTDGDQDELFGVVHGGWLYFTQGSLQQDILRMPATGLFPDYEEPAQYFELAEALSKPRTRWFALRCAVAKAAPGSLVRAQAHLEIGRLQEERGREDLAARAYAATLDVTEGADPGSPRGAVRGLAEVARSALARREQVRRAAGRRDRAAAVEAAFVRVARLEARYAGTPAVLARAALERAEILVDDGRRVEAAERLEALVTEYPGQSETAARALLRRVDLLGVAYAPEAMGEAYRQVLARFPSEQAVVRAAAERIVDTHVGQLEVGADPQSLVDALRRLAARYGPGPVRAVARWRLVDRMQALGALEQAAAELEQLVAEAGEDRLTAARGLRRLARIQEQRGRADLAVDAWRRLRAGYGDVPGFGTEARAAITRVSLERARTLERGGRFAEAADAYRRVIDNDLSQVEAHRRYFALSARVGRLEEAQEAAERRAERSARTPMARYAHALGLTWHDPPKLDAAAEELEQALALNPQLVPAYVTRGWIHEMREWREPGFFSRAVDAVVEGFGRAVGGLLDVEIGQQGPLELAIEDYTTALRLNPEAQLPEMEAEILLNLGNAHYRLAEATNDLGNMRSAFERYLEALRLGLVHKDPRTELVFWERLGRAAGWVDELAVGVMATRRALEVAEQAGLRKRDAQLVGNLALLYGLAGEDAYAREALARFEAYREGSEERSAWVVAVRDRARARLDTLSARDRAQLEAVLDALAAGRDALAGVEEMARGELPSVWLALEPNGTRAQFGFDKAAERDLNLALASAAHAGLGERRHAARIDELRLALTARIVEDVPSAALGFGDQHPTPLGVLRERLGLMLARVHRLAGAGRGAAAERALEAARAELEGWLGSDRYEKDHAFLRVDRARLWVEAAQLFASSGAAPPDGAAPPAAGDAAATERRRALEAALPRAQESLRLALEQAGTSTGALAVDPALSLPEALTSSAALARTASVAIGAPRFAGVVHEAERAAALVEYARGLLALWDAARATEAPAGDPTALWLGLDGAQGHLEAAQRRFEAAARLAARVGGAEGARLTALAFAALARVGWARGLPEARAARFAELAAWIAERVGRPDVALRATLLFAEVGPPDALARGVAALERALPAYVRDPALTRAVLARSASVALARGQISGGFGAMDRGLLLEAAAGPPVELGLGPDAEVSRQIVRAHAQARAAWLALARLDARAGAARYRAARAASVRAAAALSRAAVADRLSEAAALRLLAKARFPEEIEYDVEEGEALLLPAPIDGALHLFLVDGSTTADSRIFHAVSEVPLATARADLAAARARAVAGRPADPTVRARLRRALFGPFRAALEARRVLLVSAGFLGGTLPLDLWPEGPALTHLAAPSSLAAVRGALLVGVEGRRVVARAGAPELAPPGPRLYAQDVLPFRAPRAGAELEPGQARRLSERSAVEALADRASRALVVEAPLSLEPAAPERSPLRFGSEPADPADAFATELPLGRLDLPAALAVFGRVEAEAPEVLGRLDLSLVQQGFATSVMVPAGAPPEAARRLVRRVLETAEALGPAQAAKAAVLELAPDAPQLAATVVLGSAGLDAEQTDSYAARQVRAARTRALGLLSKRAFEAAVPAFERWIRLQIEAGQPKYVVSAYRALVAILERRLSPPDYPRAAEVQADFLEYLKSSDAKEDAVLEARLDLALLYSRAHDYEEAEARFERLLEELDAPSRATDRAAVWYKFGLHHREALRYAEAATALERAIGLWEAAGVYARADVPSDAMRALREVGEVYLNRLSDPVRAGRAYRRAQRYAKDAEVRVGTLLDLSRVARRAGELPKAAELAARTEREAKRAGLELLALSAVIEAANVAWYQGDYARGSRLCTRSLETADAMITAARAGKKGLGGEAGVRRRKIYALSVCGLVSMSQRDQEAALGYLQGALRIARALDDARETATQYNNLGRVYLEFGELEPAEAAFEQAKVIDERLKDRYALAYDLRNLGQALMLEGRFSDAERALERALEYSQQAKDNNNELRARFALGDLYRRMDRPERAAEAWQAALPLAERLDVKDLLWQIQWRLGVRARDEGRSAEAERWLEAAVRVAGSITGRAAKSALSPPRYTAFDELARLLVDQGRGAQAFAVVDRARALEQLELLEDQRLFGPDSEIPALLTEARGARTATVAKAARARLGKVAPRVAALLRIVDVDAARARLPEDAAVLTLRITREGVLGFWLDGRGLEVHESRLPERALDELVEAYARGMRTRADLSVVLADLSGLVLAPFEARLSKVRRLGLVLHDSLRYVAFAALPSGGGALVDRVSLVRALHPEAAVDALAAPLGPLEGADVSALAGAPLGRAPLPFAERELTVISEEYPGARLLRGAGADRAALLGALDGVGVLHFAGHARLAGRGGAAADPLGGALETEAGDVSLVDVMQAGTRRDLVVLSACATRLGAGGPLDGADVLSLAQTFHLAGAGRVLATTLRVEDLAAALVMKRFYRAARGAAAAEALRAAQIEVRKAFPHPAWWAGFELSVGG